LNSEGQVVGLIREAILLYLGRDEVMGNGGSYI
jgi:hypothetical protein